MKKWLTSYEGSGSLNSVAENLQLKIQKTGLLVKEATSGIFAEPKVRSAAFSEEVLNGNNSEPVEAGPNRLIVMRMLEHKPAAVQPLKEVEAKVVASILADKAKQQAQQTADAIKQKVESGEPMLLSLQQKD